MHVFGSTVYVHNDNDKTSGGRSFAAVNLGYGPLTAIILYWDNKRHFYGRCHHARHDDYKFLIEQTPRQRLLDKYATNIMKPLPTPSIMFEEVNSPFSLHNSFTNTITTPLYGPLGLI